MHFNNFFVPLVTHRSTSYVYIPCPCTYFLHTHVNRKKKRSLTTWPIYHGQSLLVRIDRIRIYKDDRWPHKNKNKNSIGGSEKEMANFHQRYTTNIKLTSLRSKAVKSDIWAPHLHIVLQIIILAYSSKIALDYTGKNIHALPKL